MSGVGSVEERLAQALAEANSDSRRVWEGLNQSEQASWMLMAMNRMAFIEGAGLALYDPKVTRTVQVTCPSCTAMFDTEVPDGG